MVAWWGGEDEGGELRRTGRDLIQGSAVILGYLHSFCTTAEVLLKFLIRPIAAKLSLFLDMQ